MTTKDRDSEEGQWPDSDTDARIIAIYTADPEASFAELVEISGLNPASDFRYANWSETDFGDMDIAGWDLTGSVLDSANLSRVKNITDATFSAETSFEGTILPEGVAVEDLVS